MNKVCLWSESLALAVGQNDEFYIDICTCRGVPTYVTSNVKVNVHA